ncbi:MAG: exo-alpha-sialidase [Thermomonas sp.]|uniref:sialidase family protein n=1 Tax=Thermomonas sp. TaxID=1971895 RepID=UPI00261661CB|nr:sialidase family protein [Thermomonas sp.]MCC7096975.1 exo-alpha-sialidase [Thermomonas sp.]
MNIRIATVLAVAALSLAACGNKPPAKPANGKFTAQVWPLPAEAGSMAPDLVRTPDGRILLSWINRREGRRNVLQFSSYTEADGWQSQPRTIAIGNSLSASAANTPHLLATRDGALWAQWLQSRPNGAKHDADVVLARSRDGGMTWAQMTRVNDDGAPAEHGFAALWPTGDDSLGIAWLDGRAPADATETQPESAPAAAADASATHAMAGMGHDGGDAGKSTQLRVNGFDLNLQRGADVVLDPHSCDCCQVTVAATARGPLLAYRARNAENVRDIATLRFENGAWSAPKIVHADDWKIDACPVAGPALAAQGNTAIVVWYSERDGKPLLQLARSTDAGDSFSAPVELDAGEPVLGRAAVAFDGQQVWVAWLRENAPGQTLMVARYSPDLQRRLQTIEVARLGARGMASGYLKLLAGDGMAWLVWTDSVSGVAHLKGARITR